MKIFSGQKILIARRKIKLNQQELAEKVGVSRNSILNWETGKAYPEQFNIDKLANALDVNAAELYEEDKPAPYIKEEPATYGAENNTIRIPVVAEVPAGYPEYSIPDSDVEAYIELPRLWAHGVTFAVRCKGESMEPTISRGDHCLIKATTEPLNNKVMLVRTPNGHTIKRVVKKNDIIELHSDNDGFKTFKVSEIKIIGRVVKVLKDID
jgi:repressor LexA